ncbi:hypothetical protein JTB14_036300 [Gonioctena quinquepunctata]|nr:hypothetical protein JTB14_036300 [Gonioctena quinquepunctata]
MCQKSRLDIISNIETLTSKINDLDQASRLNNLEIHGIQKKDNENLNGMMEKICTSSDVTISKNDIEYIHRVPSSAKYSPKDGANNIIDACSTRRLRDNIITANKLKRSQANFTDAALSVDGIPNKIYMNEHLTLTNKILHKEKRVQVRSGEEW